MKKQNSWRFALPALSMSALAFEAMPGSVRYWGVAIPEAAYHFFNLKADDPAASCLLLAGFVTAVTVILALVSAFSKKYPIYKGVAWCSLAAAALTAVPYMIQSETLLYQPNVIITIILTVCWLLAMNMEKKKNGRQEPETKAPRL